MPTTWQFSKLRTKPPTSLHNIDKTPYTRVKSHTKTDIYVIKNIKNQNLIYFWTHMNREHFVLENLESLFKCSKVDTLDLNFVQQTGNSKLDRVIGLKETYLLSSRNDLNKLIGSTLFVNWSYRQQLLVFSHFWNPSNRGLTSQNVAPF